MPTVIFSKGYDSEGGKFYPYYMIGEKKCYVSMQGKQVVYDNEKDAIEHINED